MKSILVGLLLLTGLVAQAGERLKISINAAAVKSQKVVRSEGSFTQFAVAGFDNDRTVGAPELPVKSWLVTGVPSQIQAQLTVHETQQLAGKPFPTQEQDCRCATEKVKTFQFNSAAYEKGLETVSVSYLGAYRGTPVSRVDVRLGSYNAEKNQVELTTEAEVEINAPLFALPKGDLKDYLIVVPTNLADGVAEFATWKRSQGFNVSVETVASPNNTLAGVGNLIKQNYTTKGTDFVIVVGDENTVPMFKVSTSSSSQTPSDLKYFTMDGPTDNIPDMLTSRIAATTVDQVRSQLAKSIEFEQRAFQNPAGLKRAIGIASNEGSNPSDDQYVTAIDAKFKEVLGTQVLHLQQNDAVNSKPAVLNAALNEGAFWLTYLGHGSGTSWPSMNQQYSTTNVRQINNQPAVKPVIIDVACQNGRLISGNLGTSFMKTETLTTNAPFGAAAYYGGSVNISWHPPAIMAQGIAFEHLSKKFHYLGEALLAGQLYLASHWNNQNDVIDNYEWYHLQGDPGMNISF